MASIKKGFNYYNVDTDRYQDIKIKRIKKEFGCSGIAVYDYILCEIYRVQGCFLVWDENRAFDVAEYFGIKESLVNEIVKSCGVVGLFDKAVLTRGIITSVSIQNRYLQMCDRAKRKNIVIPEECNLIQEECPIIPEESPQCSGSLPQSKVEYSNIEGVYNSPNPNFLAFEGKYSIDWKKLLDQFNKETGKNYTAIMPYVKNNILQLLDLGFTKEQLVKSFRTAANDKYLKANPKLLNLGHITDPKNFEKYAND